MRQVLPGRVTFNLNIIIQTDIFTVYIRGYIKLIYVYMDRCYTGYRVLMVMKHAASPESYGQLAQSNPGQTW